MTAIGAISTVLANSAVAISGRFIMPTAFRTSRGGWSCGRSLEKVDQILRVAQICEIRIGDHRHLVRGEERASSPSAPDMRDVEYGPRCRRAHGVKQRIE